MAPIKNIGPVNPERLREQERVRESRSGQVKRQGRTDEAAASTSRADSVDISPTAQRMAETSSDVSRFQDVLQSYRAENTEQVAEIRQRAAAGEFDQPEVLEKVSEAIMMLPNFVTASETAAPAPRSEEELQSIQSRIQSGGYQTDQILEQIATSIIRDIGAL